MLFAFVQGSQGLTARMLRRMEASGKLVRYLVEDSTHVAANEGIGVGTPARGARIAWTMFDMPTETRVLCEQLMRRLR